MKLVGAVLTKADLSKANLPSADLTNADLRNATLTDAKLEGANLTGAKVLRPRREGRADHRHQGRLARQQPERRRLGARRRHADRGRAHRARRRRAPARRSLAPNRRYFGRGDVLRNASLQFDEGATVEIESLFEQCTIALGRGTELVIGPDGVLTGCQITGAGNITINGKFFEKAEAARSRQRRRRSSARTSSSSRRPGALVGAVQQPPELTRFAFEPGCQLRMTISTTASSGRATATGNKSAKRLGRGARTMNDLKNPVGSATEKRTLVEEGTTFKGSLTSTCPILVKGGIDGDLEAPSLTVAATGTVSGKVKAGELKSEGELSGEFDVDKVVALRRRQGQHRHPREGRSR